MTEPPANEGMILFRMQPADLKKVFGKMESVRYFKLLRTSKRIRSFLEENMGDVHIYIEIPRHIHLNMVKLKSRGIEDKYKLQASMETGKGNLIEFHRKEDLSFHFSKQLPAYKTNFVFKSLHLIYRSRWVNPTVPDDLRCSLLDQLALHLSQRGIKRVGQLVLVDVKPTSALLETWKPLYTDIKQESHSFPTYWNMLPRVLPNDGSFCSRLEVEGGFEEGFEKLQRFCRGVGIKTQERTGLQRVADFIKRYHKGELNLDSLNLQILCPDKTNFEQVFPDPIGTEKIESATRFFVFPGGEYSTYLEVMWGTDQSNPAIIFNCKRWKNREEARRCLLAARHWGGPLITEEGLRAGPWKKILDECFQ